MNLLDIKQLSKNDILEIFQIADDIQQRPQDYIERLKNRTAVLFFPEESIRTRVTFEKGISMLGGKSILFPSKTLDKKEEIVDVIGYLENWADILIVRYKSQEKIESMAEVSRIPIINGMSQSMHPCEILSDLYSYRQLCRDYLKKTYTFIGENGNILKSWIGEIPLQRNIIVKFYFVNHMLVIIFFLISPSI